MVSVFILSFTGCVLLLFPLMLQPLSLGLSIMICTLMMCVCSAMFVSSWYAYVLFLIYVGGLLVMFAYVAALMPNLFFLESSFLFGLLGLFFIFFCMFFYFSISVDLSYLDFVNGCMSGSLGIQGLSLVSLNLISVYVSLAVILLLNLVVVVKICAYQQAPLRPFEKSNK